MCQDETRLGLKTIAGRLITAKGVKPVGLSQWQRENFYLYGVVEPLSGYSFFYEFPYLNGEAVSNTFWSYSLLILAMISRLSSSIKGLFTKRKLSIVQITLSRFFNLLTLPNLTQLSGFGNFSNLNSKLENCKTLAQLQQKLTDALKAITPEMIASLTSYDFILEALFSAAS